MLDEKQVVKGWDYSLEDMSVFEDSLKEDNYLAKTELELCSTRNVQTKQISTQKLLTGGYALLY